MRGGLTVGYRPTVVELAVGHLQHDVVVGGVRPTQEVHLLTGDENPQTVLTTEPQLLYSNEPV